MGLAYLFVCLMQCKYINTTKVLAHLSICAMTLTSVYAYKHTHTHSHTCPFHVIAQIYVYIYIYIYIYMHSAVVPHLPVVLA